MRKIFAAFMVVCLFPMAAFGYGFKEGKNYTQLSGIFQKASEPTLTEVFSVYCGSCYKWEKDMVPMIKLKMTKQNVKFEQVHIAFRDGYGDRISEALVASEGTGKNQAVKNAMFKAIQDDKIGDWKEDKAFFATLGKAGFSEKEFKERVKSPVVKMKLAKWDVYEKNIPSTPSFVVNGKYLIRMDSIKSFDEFYGLIDYLLQKS